jgi:hypothetical protein
MQLAPLAKFLAFDLNGDPLSGGKVYTYAAGTTTPRATYTDSTGGTANANPVILNARGEADIWIDRTLGYKLVLTDSNDVTVWTVDNIYSPQAELLAGANTWAATNTFNDVAIFVQGLRIGSGSAIRSLGANFPGDLVLAASGHAINTSSRNDTELLVNAYWDVVDYRRYSTSDPSFMVEVTGSGLRLYYAAAGSGAISWTNIAWWNTDGSHKVGTVPFARMQRSYAESESTAVSVSVNLGTVSVGDIIEISLNGNVVTNNLDGTVRYTLRNTGTCTLTNAGSATMPSAFVTCVAGSTTFYFAHQYLFKVTVAGTAIIDAGGSGESTTGVTVSSRAKFMTGICYVGT